MKVIPAALCTKNRQSGLWSRAEPGISTVMLQDKYKIANSPLLSEGLFQTKGKLQIWVPLYNPAACLELSQKPRTAQFLLPGVLHLAAALQSSICKIPNKKVANMLWRSPWISYSILHPTWQYPYTTCIPLLGCEGWKCSKFYSLFPPVAFLLPGTLLD